MGFESKYQEVSELELLVEAEGRALGWVEVSTDDCLADNAFPDERVSRRMPQNRITTHCSVYVLVPRLSSMSSNESNPILETMMLFDVGRGRFALVPKRTSLPGEQ